MIRYLSLAVKLHGLELPSEAAAEDLRRQVEVAVRELVPDRKFDSDIVVDIDESAGEPEQE